jgi:hypothetical protein
LHKQHKRVAYLQTLNIDRSRFVFKGNFAGQIQEKIMIVGVIAVGSPSLDKDVTLAQFASEPLAESSLGKLLLELVESPWSNEYTVFAYLARDRPFLQIEHSAFLSGLKIDRSGDLTVDGVKEAVLAHISAQLKDLQEQSTGLQLKSASLSDAQGHIFRATAQAAVVAMFPEAVELARAFVTRKHPKIRADMLSFKEIKATASSVEYVSFKFSDGEADVVFDTENLPFEVRLIPYGYSS